MAKGLEDHMLRLNAKGFALFSFAVAAAAFGFAAPAAANMSYNVVDGFPSTATNPSGVWTYGTTGTSLTGAFVPFLTSSFNPSYFGAGSNTPSLSAMSTGDSDHPVIIKDGTGNPNPFDYSTIQGWTPDYLLLHPGSDGEYAVVQFTAPAAGTYAINAVFEGLDVSPTTTDVHVYDSNGSLFSSQVASHLVPVPDAQGFSTTVNLAMGGTVDFAVGYGANDSYSGDSTGLKATVSLTPEPGFYGLLALGLGGLATVVAARRRRNA